MPTCSDLNHKRHLHTHRWGLVISNGQKMRQHFNRSKPTIGGMDGSDELFGQMLIAVSDVVSTVRQQTKGWGICVCMHACIYIARTIEKEEYAPMHVHVFLQLLPVGIIICLSVYVNMYPLPRTHVLYPQRHAHTYARGLYLGALVHESVHGRYADSILTKWFGSDPRITCTRQKYAHGREPQHSDDQQQQRECWYGEHHKCSAGSAQDAARE
jgi:hypothetical protein